MRTYADVCGRMRDRAEGSASSAPARTCQASRKRARGYGRPVLFVPSLLSLLAHKVQTLTAEEETAATSVAPNAVTCTAALDFGVQVILRAPDGSEVQVSIRQHTSAYVSMRRHTPAYAGIRDPSYVSIRQHTSAY
jgi:hypothetical protein